MTSCDILCGFLNLILKNWLPCWLALSFLGILSSGMLADDWDGYKLDRNVSHIFKVMWAAWGMVAVIWGIQTGLVLSAGRELYSHYMPGFFSLVAFIGLIVIIEFLRKKFNQARM